MTEKMGANHYGEERGETAEVRGLRVFEEVLQEQGLRKNDLRELPMNQPRDLHIRDAISEVRELADVAEAAQKPSEESKTGPFTSGRFLLAATLDENQLSVRENPPNQTYSIPLIAIPSKVKVISPSGTEAEAVPAKPSKPGLEALGPQ